ncbi:hypothetical protein [Pseudozobellia thermophila]|uniref:DUF4292 domain-containing protein n=1 Tax=Pseudozobellia thermophila TaxID=192903 RepID=A0A1M6CK24_9FLAO|nr:hypothetical protein [Pseudozobellia thermophila]SHI61356.1 hypothetical protein SAMN04488513_101791 [Pseudozobellia thermophila]
MRILLSSICLFLVWGCASYPKKNNLEARPTKSEYATLNPYFSDTSKDYLYKANLSLYKKEFSGLLIVKKLGAAHHRVAFTTEIGNKIFDLTFIDEDFKVNYILNKMDRKPIINLLKNDFGLLMKERCQIRNTYGLNNDTVYETESQKKKFYYYLSEKGKLKKIVQSNRTKAQLTILFPKVNGEQADRIEVIHQDIDLTISLKAI